jgi:PKD repeat protein
MKLRILLTILVCFLLHTSLTAELIDEYQAERVAKNFYYHHSQMDYNAIIFNEVITVDEQGVPVYYIFNLPADLGFVIVSAEDASYPILGFANSGSFGLENQPPNLRSWFQVYRDQILLIREQQLSATIHIKTSWQEYDEGFKLNRGGNRNIVGPYIDDILWNQGCYYNDSCPADASGPCGHVYAGCVATAASMIMKYHHHPHQGSGSYSYVHPIYGTQSANYAATTYDWGNMPEFDANANVAQLLYHMGVAVDMDYGPSGSGASSALVVNALETYFNYDPVATWNYKASYTDPVWEGMVMAELNAERPLYYRGQGGQGGHAFVCDGYDDDYSGSGNVYFHFNWGWSGIYNGYYQLSALNPGSYDFTNDQAASFNLKPRTDLVPNSSFNANANTVCLGNTVEFYDQSSNGPSSWEWTFSGGTPASSTDENPTITFNTKGKYDISLTASNAAGTGDTNTNTAMIRVCDSPLAPTCVPATQNLGNTGYGILNVSLSNLNHTTGDTYFDGGCLDLTCSHSASVEPSQSYTLDVTVSVGNSGYGRTSVYIDYNNDGDFQDMGETVINNQASMTPDVRDFVTQNITIPSSLPVNKLLRMRIITDNGFIGGACHNPNLGQSEDYGLFYEVIPLAPTALAATNVIQTSFSANWNAITGAEGYYLDVATDSLFNNLVTGYNALDVGDTNSYAVTGLSDNTDYFYRLLAYSPYGNSPYSNTIEVVTLANPPAAPVALPATNTTQNSFDANWNAVSGATGYILWVANDEFFNNVIFSYDSLDVGDVTTFQVTGLLLDHDYYYRLRAYNSGGVSPYSNTIYSPTYPNPPLIPNAQAASNVTAYSFDANWFFAFGADGYYLDVASDTGFYNMLSGYDNLDVGDTTSFTVAGLSPEYNYYYRVRSYNAAGSSANSNVINVVTLPLPPPPPNALTAVNVSQFFFDALWESSPNATGYYIDVAEDIDFTTFVSGFENFNVFGDTTITVFGLDAASIYYYRVRAYNDGGNSGNSNVVEVTTLPIDPNAPQALDPTDIAQTSFTARWRSSESASSYWLDVATDFSFNHYVSGYENLNVGADTTYQVTGLEANTTYYYRVRAENLGGTSNNSNVIFLTTLPFPPEPPVALDASNITSYSFTANWEPSLYADAYLLDVASDEGFVNYVFGYESVYVWSNLGYPVYGLQQDSTYYYRLRALNTIDTSGYSNVISVITTYVGIPNSPVEEVNIYSYQSDLMIYYDRSSIDNGHVMVFNLLGQPLASKKLENKVLNRITLPVEHTAVIVRLVINGQLYTRKVMVGNIN